jgi:cytosine/adenosine deaminase-related metal-dependent hydrolase
MVADGRGVVGCPGAVLVEGHDVIAAGTPQAVGRPAGAAIVNEPAAVVIPALVNAHCHLDLTHIGPVAYSGDLVSWLTMVRSLAISRVAVPRSRSGRCGVRAWGV